MARATSTSASAIADAPSARQTRCRLVRPAVGLVLAAAGDGVVYALDEATGATRWNVHTRGRIRSSPAIANGRVYVGSADGNVYALDLRTGRSIWTYATEGASLESGQFGFDRRTIQSSPAVVDGTVYIGGRDGFLYAISADSGRLRWRADHHTSWVITSPAVSDGVVYAGSSDNAFVQALDATDGRELWRTKIGAIVWSSPAVAGAMLFVGDGAGRMNALDRRTGAIRWSFRTGASVHSSPVVANDLLLFGSADGAAYALRLQEGPSVDRVVFFDSAFIKGAWRDDGAFLARFMANRGYRVLGARALSAFLDSATTERRPSVVVFALDNLSGVLGSSTAGSASRLRAYLDAGGKVVWPGTPPLIWPRDSASGQRAAYGAVNWSAPTSLLGVDHLQASFDDRTTRRTPSGARAGLTAQQVRADWSVDPSAVTEVLSLDDWGLAADWRRTYGGPEGTGFFRLTGSDANAFYYVAEYRPLVKLPKAK